MEKTDKAVSTEDLFNEQQRGCIGLEAAKLQAVFKTLVENKVEAIKNDRSVLSGHSNAKSLVKRLRMTSSSSATSSKLDCQYLKESEMCGSPHGKKGRRRRSVDEEEFSRHAKRCRKSARSKHRVASRSPDSPRYRMERCCNRDGPFTDEDTHEGLSFLRYDSICSADECVSIAPTTHSCCCSDRHGQIKMHCSDYISLKIDDFDDFDERELRRKRRRRRRRRRRRLRSQLINAATAPPSIRQESKENDDEELPPKARWTIVATACILLFMCLLLVGVTLRMAPIIDDMEGLWILHRYSNKTTAQLQEIAQQLKLFDIDPVNLEKVIQDDVQCGWSNASSSIAPSIQFILFSIILALFVNGGFCCE